MLVCRITVLPQMCQKDFLYRQILRRPYRGNLYYMKKSDLIDAFHTIFITWVFSIVIPVVVTLVRKVSNSLASVLGTRVVAREEVYKKLFDAIQLIIYLLSFTGNCASKSVSFSNIYANKASWFIVLKRHFHFMQQPRFLGYQTRSTCSWGIKLAIVICSNKKESEVIMMHLIYKYLTRNEFFYNHDHFSNKAKFPWT